MLCATIDTTMTTPDPATPLDPGSDLIQGVNGLPNAISLAFASKLQSVLDGHATGDGERARAMSPYTLHAIISEQFPAVAVSKTHVYRLREGKALPRLDLIHALASIFEITPAFFLVEDLDLDHAKLIRPHHVPPDFDAKLRALVDRFEVVSDIADTKPMTGYRLHQIITRQYPDIAVSKSHIYRLINGETPPERRPSAAIPRLDLIMAFAEIFDVSPAYFVDDEINISRSVARRHRRVT